MLQGARGAARFVVVTAVVSALYLLLMGLLTSGSQILIRLGVGDDQARWDEEARAMAAASGDAERGLPPPHRVYVWRLGIALGHASQRLGLSAFGSPDEEARARADVAAAVRDAEALAHMLGLESMSVLPALTQADVLQLSRRIEADETGLAARVESRTSPRHRHLFQLGMQVGLVVGGIGIIPGSAPVPDRMAIGRHATVAGIPSELWVPLTEPPRGEDAGAMRMQYGSAIDALDAALVREASRTGNDAAGQ